MSEAVRDGFMTVLGRGKVLYDMFSMVWYEKVQYVLVFWHFGTSNGMFWYCLV